MKNVIVLIALIFPFACTAQTRHEVDLIVNCKGVDNTLIEVSAEIYLNGEKYGSPISSTSDGYISRLKAVIMGKNTDDVIELYLSVAYPTNYEFPGNKLVYRPSVDRGKRIVIRPKKSLVQTIKIEGGCCGPSNRLALIIGNGDFSRCSRLGKSIPNLKSVNTSLNNCNFDRILCPDFDMATLQTAIDYFFDQLSTPGKYKSSVVYYAGYTLKNGGDLFIYGSNSATPSHGFGQDIEAINLSNYIRNNYPNRQNNTDFIFIDGCSILDNLDSTNVNSEPWMNSLRKMTNLSIVNYNYACDENSGKKILNSQNSLFTQLLVRNVFESNEASDICLWRLKYSIIPRVTKLTLDFPRHASFQYSSKSHFFKFSLLHISQKQNEPKYDSGSNGGPQFTGGGSLGNDGYEKVPPYLLLATVDSELNYADSIVLSNTKNSNFDVDSIASKLYLKNINYLYETQYTYLGQYFFNIGEINRSKECFRRAINNGDNSAYLSLAMLWLTTAQNRKTALDSATYYITKCEELNNVDVYGLEADLYSDKVHFPDQYNIALVRKNLEKAIKTHGTLRDDQVKLLIDIYEKGMGSKRNKRKANKIKRLLKHNKIIIS